MKKIFILCLLVIFTALPAMAKTENSISLSMGMNTGLMGFTFERIVDSSAFNVGFGITLSSLRLATGYRYYLPDPYSADEPQRSNFFVSPNLGLIWDWEYLTHWDAQKDQNVVDKIGFAMRPWGGLTMGYDQRWGLHKQYRLTFEGGLGYSPVHDPYTHGAMPIMNVSLGYVF